MKHKKFAFRRKDRDTLILVYAEISDEPATLALDTGATHTVIDLTILLMAGYTLENVVNTVEIETAKGTIEAYIFNVSEISCLGITAKNVDVCSYDFLANNVLTSIDGVVGLDFFENTILSIDFIENEITVTIK